MTDCSNADVRDLLPDYVNDTLAGDIAMVESHLAGCADCRNEVAILRQVVAARPQIAVDVAKIVAGLPTVAVSNFGVRAISSAPSVVRKADGFRQWRAVAALAVIAVGGMSVAVVKRIAPTPGVAVVQHDSARAAPIPEVMGDSPVAAVESATTVRPGKNIRNGALAVGEFSDFSDDELERVMAHLDKWDGATAADPLPGVPLLPRTTGGVR